MFGHKVRVQPHRFVSVMLAEMKGVQKKKVKKKINKINIFSLSLFQNLLLVVSSTTHCNKRIVGLT